MLRASLLVVVALTGCMRIYPDPELPDVEVEWYEGDCDQPGIGDVSIELTGIDDPTAHHNVTVACGPAKTVIKDVSRQRFKVVGQLLMTSGEVYSAAEYEVDLRNGFDQTAYLYFGSFDTFRVAWTFDMGATCASVGADGVSVMFSMNDEPFFATDERCELGALTGSAPSGTYSISAIAYNFDSGAVLATSLAPVPDVTIQAGMRVDIGTIVLTPCGSSCPDL
ncbi:MAG TPA: hypothetical protein VMZ53_09875 [Kofleriaceae bacterium]|nr:hypothetical protein [Kofleriaceae bacterium]